MQTKIIVPPWGMPDDEATHKPLRAAQILGRRNTGPRKLSEETRQKKAEQIRGLSARLAKEGRHPRTLAKMRALIQEPQENPVDL